MRGSAQLQQLSSGANGIPGGIPGQAGPSLQTDALPLERWHAALAAGISAELRGYASALGISTNNADRKLAEAERECSILWHDLSRRIQTATTSAERVTFTGRDVELVRWYKLVQVPRIAHREPSAQRALRGRQADNLFRALYAVLTPIERAKVDRELLP